MSSLSSILATNSSIVAHSSQPQQQAPSANPVNTAQNVAQFIASGQATIVTLSASSRGRGASFGDKKQVDAAFDKTAAKEEEKEEKDGGEKSGGKGKLNAVA